MNEYKKFTLKDRKTDYELDYKTLYDSEITIVLPAGYKVEKLPENLIQKEEDYQVEVSFSQKGNELLYRKVFIFNNAILPKNKQEKWNTTHKKLVEFYNSSITLIKS
jgi:hypothetical protein